MRATSEFGTNHFHPRLSLPISVSIPVSPLGWQFCGRIAMLIKTRGGSDTSRGMSMHLDESPSFFHVEDNFSSSRLFASGSRYRGPLVLNFQWGSICVCSGIRGSLFWIRPSKPVSFECQLHFNRSAMLRQREFFAFRVLQAISDGPVFDFSNIYVKKNLSNTLIFCISRLLKIKLIRVFNIFQFILQEVRVNFFLFWLFFLYI